MKINRLFTEVFSIGSFSPETGERTRPFVSTVTTSSEIKPQFIKAGRFSHTPSVTNLQLCYISNCSEHMSAWREGGVETASSFTVGKTI